MLTDGDGLLTLLGLADGESAVQSALTQLAHGMQPELDPGDPGEYFDWVTVNEIGLEFGFVDEAYLKALDEQLRRRGSCVLFQLYFYGDTSKTRPFPYALPFGLSFDDDRAAVRSKLQEFEHTRRSYVRDAWRLPGIDVTVAYYRQNGLLESVYCHVPPVPWPPRQPSISLDEMMPLFGRRWSDPELRAKLAPFDLDHKIAEIRSEHEVDLRKEEGLELMFVEADKLANADTRYPRSRAFAGVTMYASRELDARQWNGELPFGLSFEDSQRELLAKVGVPPSETNDGVLAGFARWRFAEFDLRVVYSNVENRILRVTVMAPGI